MSSRAARVASAVVLAVILGCTAHAARADARRVTIASFKYTPFDVRIAVGDSVEWRNADPTVHTVTASRGEFSSGSMRQGQVFRATFTVPGLYPYFCEPHEEMRGTVSVTGATPATTAVVAPVVTTTTMLAAAPSAPARSTTTTAPAEAGAPPATTAAPEREPTATPRAVVASAVTGRAEQPSPVLPVAAAVAVVLGLAGVLRNRLQYPAAALTLGTGLLHAQLRFALEYPEPIGTLLVIEAAGAAVLTAWLVVHPWTRAKKLVALGAHAAALGALAITRTGVGLFGFHEIGWDPSPQLPLAVTIGTAAIVLLLAARPARIVSPDA